MIIADHYLEIPPDLEVAFRIELEQFATLFPNRPIGETVRRKTVQDRTLQYHFGGRTVARRRSSHGVVVMAVGDEEIAALFEATPADERVGIVVEFPEPR